MGTPAPSASLRAIGKTSSDAQLVAAVRAGDDHAFERLYGRYHRRIAAYVHGMVRDHARVEDVTQEVFLSALRRLRATEQPIAFKPWVYEIAKNACIDQFRRTRRAEEVSFDADDSLGSADHRRLTTTRNTPEAAVDQKLALDNLRGAFGGLSETHHEILVMRELEGLSYRQIGDRLGMSRPAVESTLFRARRRLTEEYDELVTGKRCERVQEIIASASEGSLGVRDQRRLARHVSHCQPCRHQARLAGVDTGALERRRVRERIAALLPLPAFLRRRWLPGGEVPDVSGHVAAVSQWAPIATVVDPSTGSWIKAAAAAATIAVGGVGAGAATMTGSGAGGAGLPGSSVRVLNGAGWQGHDSVRGAQTGGFASSGAGASNAIGTAVPAGAPTMGAVSVGMTAPGSTLAPGATPGRPIVLAPSATALPTSGGAGAALPPGAAVPPVTATVPSPTTVPGAVQTVTDQVQQALPPPPADTGGGNPPPTGTDPAAASPVPGTTGNIPGTTGSLPGTGSVPGTTIPGTGGAGGSAPGATDPGVTVPGNTGSAPGTGSDPGAANPRPGAGAHPGAGGSPQGTRDRAPRAGGTTSVPAPPPPSATTPSTPGPAPPAAPPAPSDSGGAGRTDTTSPPAGTTPTTTGTAPAPSRTTTTSGTTPAPAPSRTTTTTGKAPAPAPSRTTTTSGTPPAPAPAPSHTTTSGGGASKPPPTNSTSNTGTGAKPAPSHGTNDAGTGGKPTGPRSGGR